MSKEKEYLPSKIDPFRFADNGISLEGTVRVSDMPRLCQSLSRDVGEVLVTLNFGVDEQDIRFIRGGYTTHLELQCQRCMEAFDFEVIGKVQYGIVHSEEEADHLPKHYDPVVANDGILHIQDVIEDDLIVSLPVVPMHMPQDCKVKLPLESHSKQGTDTNKENPFKVIEFLRTKHNSNK